MVLRNPEPEWLKQKTAAEEALKKGDLGGAEAAFMAALPAAEKLGEQDYRLCWTLESLAQVLQKQKQFVRAEPHLKRAFEIRRKVMGPYHLSVGIAADSLARTCYYAKAYDKSEIYAQRCVAIYEKALGGEHKDLATALTNLAMLYHMQKKFNEAEPLYKRAMGIRTKQLGADHPDTIKLLNSYADLLRNTHREAEAEHLSNCATGLITGSWKAIVVEQSEALGVDDDDDFCGFCGSTLRMNEKKCGTCGAVASRARV